MLGVEWRKWYATLLRHNFQNKMSPVIFLTLEFEPMCGRGVIYCGATTWVKGHKVSRNEASLCTLHKYVSAFPPSSFSPCLPYCITRLSLYNTCPEKSLGSLTRPCCGEQKFHLRQKARKIKAEFIYSLATAFDRQIYRFWYCSAHQRFAGKAIYHNGQGLSE